MWSANRKSSGFDGGTSIEKSASLYERIWECLWTSAGKPQVTKVCIIKLYLDKELYVHLRSVKCVPYSVWVAALFNRLQNFGDLSR